MSGGKKMEKFLFYKHEVPESFHELGILTCYRNPKSTIRDCLKSLFIINNETFNIWSHLLFAIYFIYLSLKCFNEYIFIEKAWPFLVYLVSLCLYPSASAFAHTMNTMNERARNICFFIDYWAISIYSYGSAIAYKAYVFPEFLRNSFLFENFVVFATINCIFGVFFICLTRFMKKDLSNKVLRMSSLGVPYVYDSIPLIMKIFYCNEILDCHYEIKSLYILQFVLAFCSVSFYISHFPERIFPGKFDVIGHSHQFFHLCGAFATYTQYIAVKHEMDYLIKHKINYNNESYYINCVIAFSLIALLNISIVIGFSCYSCYKLNFYSKYLNGTEKHSTLENLGNRSKHCFLRSRKS